MTLRPSDMFAKFLTTVIGVAGTVLACAASEASKVFESLQPSIVLISNAEGIGSGVVISQDGLILTNLHVANSPLPLSVKATVEQGGKRLERTFEGLKLQKVHESDDLALLKIDARDCRFLPAQLSKSETDCKAGNTCFALGFPYLPGQTRSDLTITQGIINSTRRGIEGKSYLQIDAAIKPGNSGGALVNPEGIVVGIPTLRYEGEQRIGLAIPVHGIRMKDFSDPGIRKGDIAEADRLERMASAYLARDVFSGGGDPASAVMALQLLRESLNLDPTNAHRSYMVSESYRRLGMLLPARAYAENAAKLNPTSFVIRSTLAVICDDLKDQNQAIIHYFACIPLLDTKASDFQRDQLFQRLRSLLGERRDALRILYLISWSKAILGTKLSIDEQLQIKRISGLIPEERVTSILAMKSGHSIAQMEELAKAYPGQIPESTAENGPTPDDTPVKEESVTDPVIVSEISFPEGDKARISDAPAGVVYKPEKGVVEWTPTPFSKDESIRILFLITHPDGKESTRVHTIKRLP
jgi:tetratricopeptide (TPR) repeat protein